MNSPTGLKKQGHRQSRFGSRIFDLVVKSLLCIMYVIRIQFDIVPDYQWYVTMVPMETFAGVTVII
ncbi:hypothetical protein KUTeg_000652 [Tegillarca granosa]|uniref:Bestrophin homolog n=1 Tax=Tegillarca granosa TaxID=220873 RepID=A0ABQ9G1A5_TEGGR|nr:hypothetical protein KUTeg_000652 [Tegillarca granosa]